MTSTNVQITVGGEEYIRRASEVIAAAFLNDPIARYFYLNDDNLPNDAEVSLERRARGTADRLKTRIVVGPHLVEAANWAAAAVW